MLLPLATQTILVGLGTTLVFAIIGSIALGLVGLVLLWRKGRRIEAVSLLNTILLVIIIILLLQSILG